MSGPDMQVTWKNAALICKFQGYLPRDPHAYEDVELWLLAVRMNKLQDEAQKIWSVLSSHPDCQLALFSNITTK